MRKKYTGAILALIVSLVGAILPVQAEDAAVQEAPDYAKIKTGAYLLDDNEDEKDGVTESFVDWRTAPGMFEENRADHEAGTDSRLGVRGRGLSYIAQNYARNYFRYGKGAVDSANQKYADLTDYRYFSFWYKGDGKANTLTFALTTDRETKFSSFVVDIPANDTDWHFISWSMQSALIAGDNIDFSKYGSVYNLNTSLSTKGSVVLVDNLMFSELNPMDPEATEPPDTTPDPGHDGPPTVTPGVGEFLDDNEEGGSAFIHWMGDSAGFKTDRSDHGAGAPAQLGARCRKLETGTMKYKANFFLDGVIDLSACEYLSFWYKGNGNANKLTAAVRTGEGGSDANMLVAQAVVTIPAGDTGWHFFSAPMSTLKSGGTGDPALAQRFNVSLENNGVVYIDNIFFSKEDPLAAVQYEITDLSFGAGNRNGALADGAYTAAVTVKNNTETPRETILIFAAFNPEGRLTDLSIIDVTAEAGGTLVTQDLTLTGGENHTVRVMLWGDLAGLIPLSRTQE